MNHRFLSIIIVGLACNFAVAQTTPTDNTNQSLTERFRSFRANADTYGEYKVMKATELNTFWGIVEDSLAVKNSTMTADAATITSLKNTIDGLEQELSSTQADLEESKAESSSIVILGAQINKQRFTIFFWILTFVLLSGLGIMTFKFKNSNTVTKRALGDKRELDEQIQALRHKYTEREIVLKRELQTERNKVEELRNKVMA
jgi:polyhydroxyalkanoate synthesis regulator phasin